MQKSMILVHSLPIKGGSTEKAKFGKNATRDCDILDSSPLYDADASTNQQIWDTMFQRLCSYKERHGNRDVPAQHEDDPQLGQWLGQQRHIHLRRELAQTRCGRLDDLCVTWAPNE